MQTSYIFVAFNIVIDPQILIFLVFNIASFCRTDCKFFMLLFVYLITVEINLWHRKFITADVTAVFVNDQHGIQRQGQDFDKNTQIHSAYNLNV